jgi:hypothetical protein
VRFKKKPQKEYFHTDWQRKFALLPTEVEGYNVWLGFYWKRWTACQRRQTFFFGLPCYVDHCFEFRLEKPVEDEPSNVIRLFAGDE